MKNTKGFTLVELIIVVTILAILATIAFLTLGDYTGSARDSKRVAQAKSLVNKVEILRAQNGGDYSNYVTSDSVSPAPTSADNFTLKVGRVDFTNVKESETAFTLPQANEKYIAVSGTKAASGNETAKNCFSIVTWSEVKAAAVNTWSCNLSTTGLTTASFGL